MAWTLHVPTEELLRKNLKVEKVLEACKCFLFRIVTNCCTVHTFMITSLSQSITYSLTPSLFLSVCGSLHLSPFPHCTAWLLCRQQNSSVELFPGYVCVCVYGGKVGCRGGSDSHALIRTNYLSSVGLLCLGSGLLQGHRQTSLTSHKFTIINQNHHNDNGVNRTEGSPRSLFHLKL